MAQVDADRFVRDLHELRKIGTFKTGVHRPTYTPQDMEARRWLIARMEEAGLEVEMDGIGNILGRHKGPGKKVLSGSHIESQNEAGWLDGALGCVAGMALARAGLPVDAVCLADEEGHYGGFIGSKSFIGVLEEKDIDAATNRYHGKSLREALKEAGLAGRPRLQMDADRYKGFFEMHIEQGSTLDDTGGRIGVVTGIVAIWQWRLIFEGHQNHAGTTTMKQRRDAGLAAVRLLAAIDREFPAVAGPRSVWTTGRIVLDPNAASIIPGRAEVLFQFRDVEMEVLKRMEAKLRELVDAANKAGPCPVTLEALSLSIPALCDPKLMEALDKAAERHAPGKWQRMPSGAGHDAQYMARKIPAAMLFVPSIAGISHHWAEDTRDEDLATGIRVLADAVETVAAG